MVQGISLNGGTLRYISYEALRKRWQKLLIDELVYLVGKESEAKVLRNKLYKENDKGFYVHAKRK